MNWKKKEHDQPIEDLNLRAVTTLSKYAGHLQIKHWPASLLQPTDSIVRFLKTTDSLVSLLNLRVRTFR